MQNLITKLKNMRTSLLTLIVLQYYKDFKSIYEATSFIKGITPSTVGNTLRSLIQNRDVRKVRRGVYELTDHGKRKLKYYWFKGEIPTELLSEEIRRMKVKIKWEGKYIFI